MRSILAVVIVILLVGCSTKVDFKQNEIIEQDLCVRLIDDHKKSICYGMNRADVEELTGQGEQDGLLAVQYKHGLSVMYRYKEGESDSKAKVAGFFINKMARNTYETPRGIRVGMERVQMKEAYGTKHAIDAGNMVYYQYDMEKEKFIAKNGPELKGGPEERQSIVSIEAHGEEDGDIEMIMMIDHRMAWFLN